MSTNYPEWSLVENSGKLKIPVKLMEKRVAVNSRLTGSDFTGLWLNLEEIQEQNLLLKKSVYFNHERVILCQNSCLRFILDWPHYLSEIETILVICAKKVTVISTLSSSPLQGHWITVAWFISVSVRSYLFSLLMKVYYGKFYI